MVQMSMATPAMESSSAKGESVSKKCGIVNLLWLPFSNVVWVVDHWGVPLALVVWVVDERRFPFAVIFLIPVVWDLRIWVCNLKWFVIFPSFWLEVFWVFNLSRSIFVPVVRFRGFWICNFCFINPVLWFEVFRIVNSLR